MPNEETVLFYVFMIPLFMICVIFVAISIIDALQEYLWIKRKRIEIQKEHEREIR